MTGHFLGLLQILEQIDKFNLKPEAANSLIKGVVMIMNNSPSKRREGGETPVGLAGSLH